MDEKLWTHTAAVSQNMYYQPGTARYWRGRDRVHPLFGRLLSKLTPTPTAAKADISFITGYRPLARARQPFTDRWLGPVSRYLTAGSGRQPLPDRWLGPRAKGPYTIPTVKITGYITVGHVSLYNVLQYEIVTLSL